MLNALSSTLKSESDDQSRNTTPTIPSAVAFRWIARTARRIESSDVSGNVFESSRTKNEPSSAWWTSPSSASASRSSGTNDSSAKYAIIAARCVPRSAKNLLRTRLIARQYARPDGRGTGDRRPRGDLAAGARRRRDRRRRRACGLEPRRRGGGRQARGRRASARRDRRGLPPGPRAARGCDARRERIRRPRRRAHDRGDDHARADGRPRLLRPEDVPALDRAAG